MSAGALFIAGGALGFIIGHELARTRAAREADRQHKFWWAQVQKIHDMYVAATKEKLR